MKRPFRLVALHAAALAAAVLATACADFLLPDRPQGAGSARTPVGERITPQAAMAKVALGSSTKAEVEAALGPAIVIPFDSGNEVWVYRWPGADRTPRAATELVLLFDRSGRATKARVRPGYASRD
jgi:hypothetical protein